MLERFLVPLDTSELSDQVLAYVELLATRLEQPVHLLTVADDGELLKVAPHNVIITGMVEDRRAMVRAHLDEVAERLKRAGISVTTELAVGHVVDTILAAAEKQSAGLIAMATHGRSGPERWFIGSVADRVVRTAKTPVLLMHPGEQDTPVAASIQRVILPLDGSMLGEAAIPPASFLAKTFDAPITLVRTLDTTWLVPGGDASLSDSGLTPELEETLRADAADYLEQTSRRLQDAGLRVDRVFSFRLPATEIVRQAHEQPGALIVMSTHGRSGLGRAVLGSVADRVVRTADAPVLLVRGVPQA